MITFTLEQLKSITQATVLSYSEAKGSALDFMASDVVIDSRLIKSGSVFIAIKGDRFDGHEFVVSAFEQGACCAIVSRHSFEKLSLHARLINNSFSQPISVCVVEDSKIALAQIAGWVRKQSKAKFVALTGSSGKTSVKEMTASILSFMGKVLATQGNFNNEIGVPLTLLKLTDEEEYAVIELGANHQGEIAFTASITEPDCVLINSICQAHLEGFGSLTGVAKAKSEIFTYPSLMDLTSLDNDITHHAMEYHASQHVILNADIFQEAVSMSHSENPSRQVEGNFLRKFWCDHWARITHKQIFTLDPVKEATHGINASPSVVLIDPKINRDGSLFTLKTAQGQCEIHLKILGRHAISNALAAATLALSVGADLKAVEQGLNAVSPVKGRMYPINLSNRVNESKWLIDDSYNANVGSMKAAIDFLAQMAGYKILVVGDMGEMGDFSQQAHEEVGQYALSQKIDKIYSVGHWSQFISAQHPDARHFLNKSDLVEELKKCMQLHAIITCIVKGSRSSAMEEIVLAMKEN